MSSILNTALDSANKGGGEGVMPSWLIRERHQVTDEWTHQRAQDQRAPRMFDLTRGRHQQWLQLAIGCREVERIDRGRLDGTLQKCWKGGRGGGGVQLWPYKQRATASQWHYTQSHYKVIDLHTNLVEGVQTYGTFHDIICTIFYLRQEDWSATVVSYSDPLHSIAEFRPLVTRGLMWTMWTNSTLVLKGRSLNTIQCTLSLFLLWPQYCSVYHWWMLEAECVY